MDSSALLKPTSTMMFSLVDLVYSLDSKYGDLLLPATEGIYLLNDIRPKVLMKDGVIMEGMCFTPESLLEGRSLSSLENLTSSIVDNSGKVIIPEYMMKQQDRFVHQGPKMPVRWFFIIEQLVKNYIDDSCVYRKNLSGMSQVLKHFKPEGYDFAQDGLLEDECHALLRDVSVFINKDVWHIYFANLKGIDLKVEKTVDYRVYDWTQRMESGEWSK